MMQWFTCYDFTGAEDFSGAIRYDVALNLLKIDEIRPIIIGGERMFRITYEGKVLYTRAVNDNGLKDNIVGRINSTVRQTLGGKV